MKTLTGSMLAFLLSLTLLTACGGGTSTDDSTPPPTKATVTLKSIVTGVIPQDTIIAGYDVTLTLPPGVTVKSTVNPPFTDSSAITLTTPVNASVWGIYTAATPSAPGTVRVMAIKVDGFPRGGDFATVHGDITSGYRPATTDFSQPTFTASGVDISGPDASVDLTSQLTVTTSAVMN